MILFLVYFARFLKNRTKVIATIATTMNKAAMAYVVSAGRTNCGLLGMAVGVGVAYGCEEGVRVDEVEGVGVVV